MPKARNYSRGLSVHSLTFLACEHPLEIGLRVFPCICCKRAFSRHDRVVNHLLGADYRLGLGRVVGKLVGVGLDASSV